MTAEHASPLLSIIVPIFRVERYLGETLRSILAEQATPIELILVDDGSDDQSLAIAFAALSDARVRLISAKNGGLSVARNRGIAAARGRYLMFCDSDDWYSSGMIAALVGALEANETVDIGITRFSSVTDSRGTPSAEYANYCERAAAGVYARGTLGDCCEIVGNKIFRATLLERYGLRFLEATLHEDVYFTFCALFAARAVAVIDGPHFYYRVREGSIMQTDTRALERLDGLFQNVLGIVQFLRAHPELSEGNIDVLRKSIAVTAARLRELPTAAARKKARALAEQRLAKEPELFSLLFTEQRRLLPGLWRERTLSVEPNRIHERIVFRLGKRKLFSRSTYRNALEVRLGLSAAH